MDPLTALREYTIRNHLDKISRVGDNFHFGNEYTFPATIETAYRSKHVKSTHYTLETLHHFITNQHLKHSEYVQNASANRIPPVTLPDRKALQDYLTGKISSSDSIDFTMIERQRQDALQRKDNLVAKSRIERGGEELGLGLDGGQKAKLHLKGSKIGEGVPIILVPSAFSTLITIYNVKEFLEDGVFIPTDVKVNQMKGVKPDCVTVQKKFSRDRVVTAYEVRDKPSTLKSEDWDRLVAVFVLGKEWQFKDWPYKDHVEIFNKVLGFYLRFEDDSVESAKHVKQWNVKIISISKNKRHQDRAAALEVWDRLEEFMRSRSR
ncbi:unnamed protein product [Coffea canephora]|uniref:PHP n=1 Tax=Coffea canephora TaxID=49390 RepID=A0A068TSR8_COFCA|nr:unnamed protein product [Coffea canephora]